MRGDGDTPMGGKEGEDDKYVPRDEENMRLMEKIFRNQRRIIKEVTGKHRRNVRRYGLFIKKCNAIMTWDSVCPMM